jgi:hypothetical protein
MSEIVTDGSLDRVAWTSRTGLDGTMQTARASAGLDGQGVMMAKAERVGSRRQASAFRAR